MSAGDPHAAVAASAAALLGGAADSIDRVTGQGRNSRIYRIRRGADTFALKAYPRRQDDPRDRLQAEADALELMARHHIDVVPRVAGLDRARGFLMLTWIDGSPVGPVTDADVQAADRFLTAVHALSQEPEAQRLPLASEACLSGAEIERQIRARLDRLVARRHSEPKLAAFLDRAFAPELDRVIGGARTNVAALGLAFDAPLPQNLRSLIPADFGFHNSLRRANGTLAFLDFEYFGWDDPVKLTADFLLHPAMSLAAGPAAAYRAAAERRYAEDPSFGARLDALYPLFGLRWVLVLLNEFLPERWDARVAAGARADWDEAKRQQLDRAIALLQRMSHRLEAVTEARES
jgi:hypothetical protein